MSPILEKSRFQADRFPIERVLGSGAEGTVYLATDTRLGRQVALKTLAGPGPRPGAGLQAPSLEEARLISALSHPNIVTLYDAGEADGVPYLVFEYVEGRTLAELLREEGRLDVGRAVEIAIALAQGVAYAHAQGIVHRDIKPGNVMITPAGEARLMDFGIAQRVAAGAGAAATLVGTPSYLAPETITRREVLPASDQFALGVVLYEMLAGVPPVAGADAREVVRRIAQEEFAPPSRHNAVVDEQLDHIVLQALAKDPQARHADVAALATALRNYLDPQDGRAEASQGTLEYLLRRIRHKGDFPALSSTISAVNRAAISEREPVSVLCNSILRDVALTGRLLKIVNASALNQFGGSIGTVSRAVAILGYDAVRNVAMSLVLFEHMLSRSNAAAALKDQVVAAYFSGLLARHLHEQVGLRDAEQAFICAMFHRLGRLLATFYLHEEAQVIERQRQSQGWDEERAAREVLGITYEDLGVGVARAWNFPEELLDSMRAVQLPVGRSAGGDADRLRLLSGLANDLADVVQSADEKQRPRLLAELVTHYGKATGIGERLLVGAVQTCAEVLQRDAEALGHGVARNGFLREAKRWSEPGSAPAAATGAAERVPGAPASAVAAAAPASNAAAGPDASRRAAALSAGVQEITSTLVGEHPLNDVLRIILETMYRAIGFHRVLLFLPDGRQQALRCRFGFGPDVEAIVQRGAAAPVNGPRDLFYAAVTLGNDLCIEDLEADKVRAHVPGWYRQAIGARGMLLLPIVNRKRTVALIYADSEDPQALRFTAEEMGLLRTLRNQALLALRQAA